MPKSRHSDQVKPSHRSLASDSCRYSRYNFFLCSMVGRARQPGDRSLTHFLPSDHGPTRPESSRKPQPLAAEADPVKVEALERQWLGGSVRGWPWAKEGRKTALAAQLFQSTDAQQNPQRLKQNPEGATLTVGCSNQVRGCPRAEGRWGHRATYLPQGCCAEESVARFPRMVPGLTCHLLRNRTRSHRWSAASPQAPVPWAPAACQGGAARGGSR